MFVVVLENEIGLSEDTHDKIYENIFAEFDQKHGKSIGFHGALALTLLSLWRTRGLISVFAKPNELKDLELIYLEGCFKSFSESFTNFNTYSVYIRHMSKLLTIKAFDKLDQEQRSAFHALSSKGVYKNNTEVLSEFNFKELYEEFFAKLPYEFIKEQKAPNNPYIKPLWDLFTDKVRQGITTYEPSWESEYLAEVNKLPSRLEH